MRTSTEANQVHTLLSQCYSIVLPGVEVAGNDNFFALGGDSLQLIRLVALAQEEVGVEVDAIEFFVEPTMDRLLDVVCEALGHATAA